MEIIPTKIRDCFIIKPTIHNDNRGYFFESFNEKEFTEKTGLQINFVQDNQSYSRGIVLRGLHFQKGKHAQAKLVKVAKGSVYDVAVDLRVDSPTFGEYVGVELNDSNCEQLFIPRGCAHGFATLNDDGTILQYKCDNYYCKEADGGISWKDESINIDWFDNISIYSQLIMSEKDKNLSPIAPYVFKLIRERIDFDKKRHDVLDYLNNNYANLSDYERDLIKKQENIMREYYDILTERLTTIELPWDEN